MINIPPLKYIHKEGLFGDYENKKEDNLLKITETKNLTIVQLAQYKNSTMKLDEITVDDLKLKDEALSVVSNDKTRILWNSPKNWLLVSSKNDLIKNIENIFKSSDFAVTDLSHSKTIIELHGTEAKEILKKGCPFDFNNFNGNKCINSIYNGIAFTADIISENPDKIRLFVLRSFGESFYHSITDSALEFGYKAI